MVITDIKLDMQYLICQVLINELKNVYLKWYKKIYRHLLV